MVPLLSLLMRLLSVFPLWRGLDSRKARKEGFRLGHSEEYSSSLREENTFSHAVRSRQSVDLRPKHIAWYHVTSFS